MTREQEWIEDVVAKGAAIRYDWMPEHVPIAAVRWEPGKFYWAELGGIDQSALHVLPYTELKQEHDLGSWVIGPDPDNRAYIAPWGEWPELDVFTQDDFHRLLADRDAALADPIQRERFDDFFANGI